MRVIRQDSENAGHLKIRCRIEGQSLADRIRVTEQLCRHPLANQDRTCIGQRWKTVVAQLVEAKKREIICIYESDRFLKYVRTDFNGAEERR